MPDENVTAAFGAKLKRWRGDRKLSQLALALELGISPRHLSFVETGRSRPSRELVLLLAEHLDVPLRERNALLLAAGYAPVFPQRALDDPEMAPVRDAVALVLEKHEPFPAIAVDRRWNVIMGNRTAPLLRQGVPSGLLGPPPNVYRISLHPEGLAPRVLNYQEYARHMLAKLRHDASASGDPELVALLAEVEGYPGIRSLAAAPPIRSEVVLPLRLRHDDADLAFITTISTFGTPLDVTVSELAIECFFPADELTAARLRSLGPVC